MSDSEQLSAGNDEYQRCLNMLGDVPGATLEDRLTHYIGSYTALQVAALAPAPAVAEGARTEISRLEQDGWNQASIVSGYWMRHLKDDEIVNVCNGDLRKLSEATHEVVERRSADVTDGPAPTREKVRTEALRKQAFDLTCREQFRLASFIAENLGYVLAPEPTESGSGFPPSQKATALPGADTAPAAPTREEIAKIVLNAINNYAEADSYGASYAVKLNKQTAEKTADAILARCQAEIEPEWIKILADNWRGRNGNTITGDSVRNSCADELEKVAARHYSAISRPIRREGV